MTEKTEEQKQMEQHLLNEAIHTYDSEERKRVQHERAKLNTAKALRLVPKELLGEYVSKTDAITEKWEKEIEHMKEKVR